MRGGANGRLLAQAEVHNEPNPHSAPRNERAEGRPPVSVLARGRARRMPTLPALSVHLSTLRRGRSERESSGSMTPRRSTRRITIVLADAEHLIRSGIRCLLEMEEDFAVVREVADGLKVVDVVARLRPRILIVALAMPGLNGLEIARQVRQKSPATAVLMLSRYAKEQYVVQALRNGAAGFVVKFVRRPELVRAIRKVVAGEHYLSVPFSEQPLRTWLRRAETGVLDAYETLTDREREVLQLISEGDSSVVIAGRLSISPRTVEAHRASIMRKMGFRNIVDVVLFAVTRGILVLPSEPALASVP
jgi:DNA-binding NarL/FixJ family response regulator